MAYPTHFSSVPTPGINNEHSLKHKYKYALSTNLPCASRRSQFLALLCIFLELISLHRQPRNTVFCFVLFCFYRLFKSLVAVAFVSVLAFLDALSVCYS